MLQTVILGFGVALAAGLAVAVAVKYLAESRYSDQRTFHQSRDPVITNVPLLGDCSYCIGEVNALNGYHLPCHHPIHYTCSTYIKGILKNSTMLCKICSGSNPRELGEGSNDEGSNRLEFYSQVQAVTTTIQK